MDCSITAPAETGIDLWELFGIKPTWQQIHRCSVELRHRRTAIAQQLRGHRHVELDELAIELSDIDSALSGFASMADEMEAAQ